MSFFNKPKRNIRRRHGLDDEEDNENGTSESNDHGHFKNKVNKKDKPKQTIVSFGAEMEEGDDGEVFKVKKSSRSRRLKKQLDQERKKKKDEERMFVGTDLPSTSNAQDKDLEIKTDDLIVKIKNSSSIILNDQDGFLSSMGDEYSSEHRNSEKDFKRHEFVKKSDRSESMNFIFQSGCIPDAAMIHAARKRRQRVRESANNDYIPIEEQSNELDPRLLGREDNQSDEEDYPELMSMNINTEELDKEKRRQAFFESQEKPVKESDEESEPELEDWETQQIRKVVTGASLVTVPSSNKTQVVSPPSPPNPTKCVLVSSEQVLNRIRDRLKTLRELYRNYESKYEAVEEELEQSKKELKETEIHAAELAEKYKQYQEQRFKKHESSQS